jgi:AhpD family alkylhydroperoxidase
MARIELPEGDAPEIERAYWLRPEMGIAVGKLAKAVYDQSILPPREREAARMRIAELNGCGVCLGWRIPELAAAGVDEELYAHVSEWRDWSGYSERERLAIEYAERFATDHRSIDEAFMARMREHFSDAEVVDLGICVAQFLAFGRLTRVLDLDSAACAI